MAKAPKKVVLTREDLAGSPSWFEKVLNALTPFLGDVQNALSKGLTRQENMASFVKTITLNTGATVADSFPLYIANELPSQPYCVQLAQVLPKSAAANMSITVGLPIWSLNQKNQIQVLHIPGLEADTQYLLTFIVE